MSVASRPFRSRVPRRRQTWAGAVILLIAVGVAVLAVGRGSAPPVVAQTRSMAPFRSVALAGSNLVDVHMGSRSVVVQARVDMLDHVTTEVRAGTLVIADAPGHANTKGPMRVSVTMPALSSLVISSGGSGVLTVTGLHGHTLGVTVAGSGLVRATGTTTHLTAGLSGSGGLELSGLTARDARLTLSGSGRAVVTATTRLAAVVSGDGVIQYGGNPAHLSTRVTGDGAIIPG